MPLSIIPNEGLNGGNCFYEEPAGRAKVCLADGREIVVMHDKHLGGYHSRNYAYTERASMFILDPERLPDGVRAIAEKRANEILGDAEAGLPPYAEYVAWYKQRGLDPFSHIVDDLLKDVAVYTDLPRDNSAPWYLLPMNTGREMTGVFSHLLSPLITDVNQYGVGTRFLGHGFEWSGLTWGSGSAVREIELQTTEQADETYREQRERSASRSH